MPTCKLPYKSSFDNSRVFLQDFEVIDDSFKILNDREFDSLINELEQNNIKAYNISGKPWLKDVSRGSEYAIPNLKVLDKIDQKRKDLGLYEDQLSAQIQLVSERDKPTSTTQYQNVPDQSIGITASEKTIRDLATRMSDRIGIPVKFISDRSQKFKGKIEDNVAVINLAYATLDTPIHEILAHPIIRVIKNKTKLLSYEEWVNILIDPFFPQDDFVDTSKEAYNKYVEWKKNSSQLYNNLLKELEYGRGKDVLDRIKRDYNIKSESLKISLEDGAILRRNINNSENKQYEYQGKLYTLNNLGEIKQIYTLEEQQEEAIVELLGLMTAEKLDAVKDGKLISLLKRLLKEIKAFVKDLLKQREVEIDKLPDDMTLGDLSDLLAYSNSKLILPGYEVKYTTPDNKEFETYAEASKHISNLAKSVKEVDLNNIKINEFNNIPDEFETPGGIVFKKDDKYYLKELYPNFDEEGNFINEKENIIEISKDRFISQYKDSFDYHLYDKNLSSFIEKNKEYEQSKEIIEEWKKVNNIRYNPEEIYSRGQEFSSVVGAYSSFDVNLMMQNLLHHIEDNEKAGGKFAISAYTKPVDRKIGHLEGGGGKIKFKIYPQSEDILWAANRDVYSGSVWDASEKVNKDKKSELLGVSYTKYPSLPNTDAVQSNLASIVDNLSYHHNELGIVLTGSNFRLEYDDNIPYQTKKIIDSINSILDQKYGKLVTPEIKRYEGKIVKYGVFSESANDILEEFKTKEEAQKKVDETNNLYWYKGVERAVLLENDTYRVILADSTGEDFIANNGVSKEFILEDFGEEFGNFLLDYKSRIANIQPDYRVVPIKEIGVQPTQTNETLKESIDSVKSRTGYKITVEPISKETYEKAIEDSYSQSNGMVGEWTEDGLSYFVDLNDTVRLRRDKSGYFKESGINSEYTSQALINTKIAALKEVAKKYPRSLIRSEVKQKISSTLFTSEDIDLPFQKIPSVNQDKLNNNFFQSADEKPYEVTPTLKSTLEQFVKKINPDFKIEVLDDLLERRGVNGIAKLSAFVIQLQRGKEGALPEEVAHFLIELLDNEHPLKKTMKDEITRTRLYKTLRQNPFYKKTFGNDTDGFKREAMAKLVALYLTDKESFKYQVGSDSVYENILRWIKDFFRWIKGKSNSIASFIEAADKIVNLDTTSLVLDQARAIDEMYSAGDFFTEPTTLTTVRNLNTTKYDRVLVNLSDTIFDTKGYSWDNPLEKRSVLMGNNPEKLKKFYETVDLTNLGRELQDKIRAGSINNVTFYSSMLPHEILMQRLKDLFGDGVQVSFVEQHDVLEDEDGNIIKEIVNNPIGDFFKSFGVMETIIIDNKPPKEVDFNINFRQYNDSKSTIYERLLDKIQRQTREEDQRKRRDSFLEELKRVDRNSVTAKIGEGFQIIRNEYKSIEALEQRLSKEDLGEDYDSLFREDGDLLLPITQADKGKRLLEKMNKFEEASIQFFGTIEAVTNFFKDRNDANYEQIRQRLAKATEDEIDMAIQELSLVNKMGQKWENFITDFTKLFKDTPNTATVDQLLGALRQQIETSKSKSRELAVQAIGEKFEPLLEGYNANRLADVNLMKERLEKASEADKPAIEQTIKELTKDQKESGKFVDAGDIIDVLNGEEKDLNSVTVYIKTLPNTSDNVVGLTAKLLRKAQAEVEVSEIARAQQLGYEISEIEKSAGITEKEWQEKLLYQDNVLVWEGEGENRRQVPKPAWTLLHGFKDEWKKDVEYNKVQEKRKLWKVAEQSNATNVQELFDEFVEERDKYQNWLNVNWHQEYKQEFYERYKELQTPENKSLFEEIKETQEDIYSAIDLLRFESQYQEGASQKETQRKILAKQNELKELKRDVNFDGTPKVGRDLEKAKLLQQKALIDQEFFEYEHDFPRFRRDFLTFLKTQNLDTELFENIKLKLNEDNLTDLFKYVRKNNLFKTLDWLENNTKTQFHKDWYEKRKELSDKISDLSDQIADALQNPHKSTLSDLWQELFNLTSNLRDEDHVFDGAMASPEIQSKVKEFESEIERIKQLSKELPGSDSPQIKALKKELREYVKTLSELQQKRVTDSYKDTFNEMMSQTGFKEIYNENENNIYMEGINLIDFINYSGLHKKLAENPEHDFTKWFNANQIEKEYFDGEGVSKGWFPTYIWMQIEPTDANFVLTVPSFKYSNRVVQEKHKTLKEEKTFNFQLNEWNPKSVEFMNPAYKQLMESPNSKDRAMFAILGKLNSHHLSTQGDTNVREGKIRYTLPYVKKQIYEDGYLQTMKRDFFDQTNRFEEGEGNFQETGRKTGVKKTLDKLKAWWNNQEQAEEETEEIQKIMRVAVPFTKYHAPENISKDALLSIVRFSASTRQADKMMKSLPLLNLIEDSLQSTSKVDKRGKRVDNQKERVKALKFLKENLIYGINNQFELGTGIESVARTVRKVNTIGSLGLNVANVVKNNFQGRLQNLIGSTFADWSSSKSMTKASLNIKTNYAWFLSQGEKSLPQRDIHFHILAYYNPELEGNIYDNVLKGSTKRNAATANIMLFNKAMEFSISSNLLFGHLYHKKVKNQEGEIKELFDILTVVDGRLTPKKGFVDLQTGQEINADYLLNDKLAYSTVSEYVQGKVSAKTYLSTLTIGQALLYFKNWLIPMLRRRFDWNKQANYMVGDDLEGYWIVWGRLSINMLRDILRTHRANWNSYTPREQREYIVALKEIGVMFSTLMILSLIFGFDADDPDKFKKLKNNSMMENYALLLLIQTKNETEALSAMPFINTETSFIPPLLTEGTKFLTNPTIGLAIIDNTWKTLNYTYELLIGSETAYYDKNMPQFGIEKGDSKAWRYMSKVIQYDEILNADDPDQKIRTIIGNMKR